MSYTRNSSCPSEAIFWMDRQPKVVGRQPAVLHNKYKISSESRRGDVTVQWQLCRWFSAIFCKHGHFMSVSDECKIAQITQTQTLRISGSHVWARGQHPGTFHSICLARWRPRNAKVSWHTLCPKFSMSYECYSSELQACVKIKPFALHMKCRLSVVRIHSFVDEISTWQHCRGSQMTVGFVSSDCRYTCYKHNAKLTRVTKTQCLPL